MKRKEQEISSNVSPDMAMENMMSDTKATNKETKCQNAGKYQERLRDSLAYCYAKRTCGNPLMYSAIFRALISKQKSHHEVIKIHHFYTFDEFSVQ